MVTIEIEGRDFKKLIIIIVLSGIYWVISIRIFAYFKIEIGSIRIGSIGFLYVDPILACLLSMALTIITIRSYYYLFRSYSPTERIILEIEVE